VTAKAPVRQGDIQRAIRAFRAEGIDVGARIDGSTGDVTIVPCAPTTNRCYDVERAGNQAAQASTWDDFDDENPS
jgi:hypothetical protein